MIEKSLFRPCPWLANPHVQTIWASKLRRLPSVVSTRERVVLADGDFLDLNWSTKRSDHVVCLFHGLGGSFDSPYAKGMFIALEQAGYQPVFVTFRGASQTPNKKPFAYHSGHTDDIRFLIEMFSERKKHAKISAIGFSLGANALLKYLGEESNASMLNFALAVSPPLVLRIAADTLDTGAAKIYQHVLLSTLKKQIKIKQETYPHFEIHGDIDSLDTFWKLDNEVTAPLNGFRDADDYYQRCSARPFLKDIQTPTHVIHSADDPFFTPEVIPTNEELSPSVRFELTEHGGHVGFIAGSHPLRLRYWIEERALELLAATCSQST